MRDTTKRDDWYKLIDELEEGCDTPLTKEELSPSYMYRTKSGKFIIIANMTSDYIRNCLWYVRKNEHYWNREGVINYMEKLLWYRITKEGYSDEDYYNYINNNIELELSY